MIRPGSKYVSTVREVYFDRARMCSSYFSIVLEVSCAHARGMFQPCARNISTVLERAGGMFRLFSR